MSAWRPSSPEVANIETLTELRSTGDFVVHVWAEWNGYDRKFDQKLQTLIEHMTVRVFSLDTDERQFWELLVQCNVTNVPALLVLRDGAHIKTIQNYDAEVALSEASLALQAVRTES